MTHEQKRQIRDALLRYAANFETQAEAAASLENISATTLSLVKNHNWELLSDKLWHSLARQVGFYSGDWHPADTAPHLLLRLLMGDAQRFASLYCIAMGKGIGKTFTASWYAHLHHNVIRISGSAACNRKSFLEQLLRGMEQEATGSASDLLERCCSCLAALDQPLLIVDNAHLLKDRVLHLVVLLAGRLSDACGFVLMGPADLRWRIIEGARLQRPGFAEMYKAIGSRFATLSTATTEDTALVCRANGIHDGDVIRFIAETAAGNLHSATTLILQHRDQALAA